MAAAKWIGGRIAPPRFILFVVLLVAGVAVGIPLLGPGRGVLAGFDLAALVFLLSIVPLLGAEADDMRRRARANDANREVLLGITGAVMLAVLVAVAKEIQGKADALSIGLVVATLVLAWLFSNIVYALHYAHLWYLGGENGSGDAEGLDFPDTEEPDYWDFIYFSFTLGVAVATSDVSVKKGAIRRVVIGQCLAGYVYNIGVVAFTISVLSSH